MENTINSQYKYTCYCKMCVFMYVERTDFEEIPFSLPFPVRQAFSNPSLGSFPSFGRQMLTSVFALLRYAYRSECNDTNVITHMKTSSSYFNYSKVIAIHWTKFPSPWWFHRIFLNLLSKFWPRKPLHSISMCCFLHESSNSNYRFCWQCVSFAQYTHILPSRNVHLG